MKDERINYTLRISREMIDKLHLIAEFNHRSTNAELTMLVEDYIKANQDILDKQQSSKH